MKRRMGMALAAVAAAMAAAGLMAPAASAATLQPQAQQVGAFGSVSLCTGIPVGPITISVCI